MKTDLRISIKDYRRNKNLKTQPPQISFDLSRRDILKIVRCFNAGVCRHREPSPAVPAGLGIFPTGPDIKMPGYFQWFLRNRTPGFILAGQSCLSPLCFDAASRSAFVLGGAATPSYHAHHLRIASHARRFRVSSIT